jgi:hypothetical protein
MAKKRSNTQMNRVAIQNIERIILCLQRQRIAAAKITDYRPKKTYTVRFSSMKDPKWEEWMGEVVEKRVYPDYCLYATRLMYVAGVNGQYANEALTLP